MDEAMRELVRGWMVKGQHDLATAKKLASEPDPYLDTAIYHCQQAAEKAIKGFLTFHGLRFEKTHNIPVLIGLALPLASGLRSLLDAAERLTPYATAFRYPGEVSEPDRTEFDSALADARQFLAFILSMLPKEFHP